MPAHLDRAVRNPVQLLGRPQRDDRGRGEEAQEQHGGRGGGRGAQPAFGAPRGAATKGEHTSRECPKLRREPCEALRSVSNLRCSVCSSPPLPSLAPLRVRRRAPARSRCGSPARSARTTCRASSSRARTSRVHGRPRRRRRSSGTVRGSAADRARPGVNYNVFAENDAAVFRCAAALARSLSSPLRNCAPWRSTPIPRRFPDYHGDFLTPPPARSQVPALRRPPGHEGQPGALGGDLGLLAVYLRLPGAPDRAVARVRGRPAQRGPPQLRHQPPHDPRDRVAAQPVSELFAG